MTFPVNPELDLVLERELAVPVAAVWEAWTTPAKLMPWFCPLPWTTVACEIDLRPGGKFATTMQSPEGEQFPSEGCYLEVVPERRLVWTSVLGEGFRPIAPSNGADDMPFTAVLEFEPTATGTRYRATAIHPTREHSRRHAEMGFADGWGECANQLERFILTGAISP
jgi:uncharacterized protein YndB with AHSA1/START domain